MFLQRSRLAAAAAAGFGPIVFVVFVDLASTRAVACPAPQWAPTELGINEPFPVDTGLTYNGRRAAVRSAITVWPPTGQSMPYASGVTFWDLTTAVPPTGSLASFSAMGEGIDVLGTSNGYQPSDLIELTNTRCVAIGSGYSPSAPGQHDLTYIDLFDASATPSRIKSAVVGNNTAAGKQGGFTNDVAITRDGALAVINADNYVCFLDVGNGGMKQWNIGYDGYYGLGNPANICSPNSAVDSVAVTNDWAVVTTSRAFQGTRDTWVFIHDLAGNGRVVLEQQVFPTNPTVEVAFRPHDVEITPNGELAVVTSNRMVSLFELTTFTMVAPPYYDPYASRLYQRQVDSVEVTNDRAVVISEDVQFNRWQIDVFAISATATVLQPLQTYWGPSGTSAHDLELVPDHAQALVRTSHENVFINDLINPPANPISILSPNGSNAHEYLSYTPYTAFSSDSVVIGSPSEDSMIAVTIGARDTTGFGSYQGYVDFIDVLNGTLLAQQTITSAGANGVLPLDLTLTRDRSEVAVRSSDTWIDLPTAPGADVTVFSMTAFNLLQGYGGTGFVMGADSVAAGHNGQAVPNNRKRIISTSEDPLVPDGKVHLVDR